MIFDDVAIPYGAYWSTPFAKWRGSLRHRHALLFAAETARRALARRGIDPGAFDYGVLGTTVPQKGGFYGLPWLMEALGAGGVHGPTIAQACATGVRLLASAAGEIAMGGASCALAVAADRVSDGPTLRYPAPGQEAGQDSRQQAGRRSEEGHEAGGETEDWVLDNFAADPATGRSMLETAETVARKYGIDTAEQHEVALMRAAQYADALADDRAFQRRYMDLPFDLGDGAVLAGDEGVYPTTREGLARLRPVLPDGSVTYGGQTHPADGNAAIVLARADRARELSRDPGVGIRLVAFGSARAAPAHMPEAPVPATGRALAAAGLGIADVEVIKSHNPFAVNDVVFARGFGIPLRAMNNFGCSLVWGHPQGPTGLRGVIELIEELVLRGGGRGLFQGCAAGDTAMAVIVEVEDAR